MPWVLDEDVGVRDKERRLDEAYYTRRWPWTGGASRTYDVDPPPPPRGRSTSPRPRPQSRRPWYEDTDDAGYDAYARPSPRSPRSARRHAGRHRTRTTVVDHEHPTYETHEIVHRHHYPRYEREVEFDEDVRGGAYRGGDRGWDAPPRQRTWEVGRGPARPWLGQTYGELTDGYLKPESLKPNISPRFRWFGLILRPVLISTRHLQV